ncbi:MAG: bifunctional oligoribonuclease/PAP phosphatase NrnA [Oscillospiraceae bacterium]|nr:bifunctional oligoribonuclease/PAP phosphatase NrnA [Oscillospiraceae bacterium]
MSIMLDVNETANWLKERDNFLILTHRRPDGDTVGSAGALAQGLREIGKTAYILPNPEITPRYAPYMSDYLSPADYCAAHVIIVDTASTALFPKNGEMYFDQISLCIDHHPSNTLYAEYTCLDASTASCGEIIYEILTRLNDDVSAKSAECIYVAVSTDTGCFSFANTTANTLRVASLVVQAGAPHVKLNRKLFRTKSQARVKIESMIVAGLEFYFDGKVAIASISNEMMAHAGADEDDIDDITSLPGVVKGVIAGITIRELNGPHDCKVSVRTSPTVNANGLAARFGGGGHAMASGFSLDKPIAETKAAILNEIKDFLPSE